MPPVHAFSDDALGQHDAVALADLVRRGKRSAAELNAAAAARAERVDPALQAIEVATFEQPITGDDGTGSSGAFAGVPMFIKDNVDVRGLPTRHGSRATASNAATKHDLVTRQFLHQGFTVLGKTRLPEFGFSPSTEFEQAEPTRNPWNIDYSSGASSGGSAALVAAGVVPVAHANDGGGSIRIPASCCGLVGLKVTRGRTVLSATASQLPLKIVSEGLVTRTVRDTAHFVAGAERFHRGLRLPPVGLVQGPSGRRLRIGLVLDSIGDNRSCEQTRAVVERTARVLEKLGHTIEPLTPPVPHFFTEDFKLYWAFLAFSVLRLGRRMHDDFQPDKLDPLTVGLANYYKRNMLRTPLALARLRASSLAYRVAFRRYDAVLSPVVSHAVPKLGHLSPRVPFDELFARIQRFAAFTPLNNAAGSPAISVPGGLSREGVPIGVHFSAAHGAEATLLDLAYQLEAEIGFARTQAGPDAPQAG